MDPTMMPYPIESAPRPGQDAEPLLLYCPDQACWYTGVWSEGAWRLQADAERVLHPTHWLPTSTDVVVDRAQEKAALASGFKISDRKGKREGSNAYP